MKTRVRSAHATLSVICSLAWVCVAEHAQAATQPLNCQVQGWNVAPYYFSSYRHPLAERSYAWDDRYENNIDYQWQVWLNANVTQVQFVFDIGTPPNSQTNDPGKPGFELEPDPFGTCPWDYLEISGSTTIRLCDNLDQNHTVQYTSPAVAPSFAQGSNDNYVSLRFHSDVSNTFQGFAISQVRYYCSRVNTPAGPSSNVSRLHDNGQREGILAGPGDIRYFSTVQEPNNYLVLALRPENPNSSTDHTDFDLYASPTSPTNTPGPGVQGVDYQWASTRGRVWNNGAYQMQDDYIVIAPPGGVNARYIYYSVYWYPGSSGAGGFRVYDNLVSNMLSFRVATDFNDRADPSNWTKLQWAMQVDAAGLYNATDGLGLWNYIDFWHNDNTCGGLGCDIIYQQGPYCSGGGGLGVCTATGCHPSGNFFNLGTRIMFCYWATDYANNDPLSQAEESSHEFGHCLYGFPHETGNGYPDYLCGHNLLVSAFSPEWRHVRDYCTGTLATGNHGMDPAPGTTGMLQNNGEWTLAQQCAPTQFTKYLPAGLPATPDPEAWELSNMWADNNFLTIVQQN